MCPNCHGSGFLKQPELTDETSPSESDDEADLESADDQADMHATCPDCRGARLNRNARSVRIGGYGIHDLSNLSVLQLRDHLSQLPFEPDQMPIAERPLQEIVNRLDALDELGLGYLSLDRAANTLSGGEAQRIRLAHQVSSPLSGVLYILDEPSIVSTPRITNDCFRSSSAFVMPETVSLW
jgi:excinuclease ABC subunit A